MNNTARRLIALCLAIALCVAPAATANDPESDANSAQRLYDLGLFKGTGYAADGSPEFDLDRPADRVEALIMLIRLLGKESDVLACTASHPFTDVPAWANNYVAYGYSQGLTNGVDSDKFGSSQPASANMYLTFVLRALGYDDRASDAPYSYLTASDYAQRIGLASKNYGDSFLRSDVAEASHRALGQKENGSERTLIQSLVDSGAVGISSARRQGFEVDTNAFEGQTVAVAVESYSDRPYDSEYRISAKSIGESFPTARYCTGVMPLYSEFTANFFSLDRASLYISILTCGKDTMSFEYGTSVYAHSDDGYAKPYAAGDSRDTYLLDEDLNVIACYSPAPKSDGVKTSVEFVRTFIETAPTAAEIDAILAKTFAKHDSVEVRVDWDDPQAPWDDGGGMSHTYPVYVDGKEITSDYYLAWQFSYAASVEDAILEVHRNMLLTPPRLRYDDGEEKHMYFSDEPYASYGSVWNSSGSLIENHFGVRVYDKYVDDPDTLLIIAVYDKAGNMLGCTSNR